MEAVSIVKICKLCGKLITNPTYNQQYHKEGDPENKECYQKRMRLNWQHASSNYRLKTRKRKNNNIIDEIRILHPDGVLNSRDENGGRIGTGSLGEHHDPNEDMELKKVRNEMRRCGLKSLL